MNEDFEIEAEVQLFFAAMRAEIPEQGTPEYDEWVQRRIAELNARQWTDEEIEAAVEQLDVDRRNWDTHTGPEISIEIRRYVNPDVAYGFHSYTPDQTWNVYPLGRDEVSYSHQAQLYNKWGSEDQRRMLGNLGFKELSWDEVPEVLKDFIVDQVIPMEWKSMDLSWIGERTVVRMKEA